MPITKRALLISNPGEKGAENYCKGVYVDITRYQNLLTSAEGGGWESHEIKPMDRPSAKEVRDWLASNTWHDYVLVMFSGHGCYSAPDKDRVLELRKGENMLSNDLRVGAKRRTVILDCCQKVYPESFKAQIQAFAERAEIQRTANRAACQKHFADMVQAAPTGIVMMTSCAIGEVSTDDDARGGRYNGSLMECVEGWILTQKKQKPGTTPASLSVVASHECAAERTRKLSEDQQNPGIEKPKTGPYFPFAVFA